jgi:hypothetical protein
MSIPEEFTKVIKDFIKDIKETFPEYIPFINKWWKEKSTFDYVDDEEEKEKLYLETEKVNIEFLFKFCQKKLPPRFFDILYQNEDIFKEESEIDTEFLPHIYFKNLWQFEVATKTHDTIWKYLQLIVFSIVGTLENKEAFGDSAKLFDNIDQSDFKLKLEETLSSMQGLFESNNTQNDEGSTSTIPSANDLNDHITGMLGGKLGQLAQEIAEETSSNLGIDMENVTDMKDIFNSLLKNPTKLMGLVKNVGDKLDSRIKSGEIKESELMSEASDLMNKMKNMPGMDNINEMLNKMGMGDILGKGGGKVNMGATEAALKKNMKNAQIKERMNAKLQKKQAEQLLQKTIQSQQQIQEQHKKTFSDAELEKLFNTADKIEKTPRKKNKK